MINIDGMNAKTEAEELEELGFKNGAVDFDEQIADLERPHIKPDPEPAPAALPPNEEVDQAIMIGGSTALVPAKDVRSDRTRTAAAICGLLGILVITMLVGSLIAVAKMQDALDKAEGQLAMGSTTADDPAEEEPVAEEKQPSEQTPSEGETEAPTERWIGSEQLGYLKVETYWRQISLADSAITNRAIYENGNYYITMADLGTNNKTPAKIGEEWLAKVEEEGAESVQLGVVEMNDLIATQLQGYYREQNIWTKTWFYQTSDGHLRYITVEGPNKTNKYFAIPNTYQLKK